MNSHQDKSAVDGAASNKKTENTSKQLDKRLEALGSKIDERRGERDPEAETKGLADNHGMAYGLKIGSEFVSAILVGSAIGWVLDKWLGTTPFGLIVFLILGFAAGVLNVMRATGQVASPGAKDR
ncbi:MAG: AtpZ/AtpI family protein [Hyphomicrobiales bacterium]